MYRYLPATVAEAYTVLFAQNNPDFDNYLAGYFKAPDFFEVVCPVNAAPFGAKLNDLVRTINNGQAAASIDKEWFLDLAEKIIYHEYGNYLAPNDLHSIKLETRKDLDYGAGDTRSFMSEFTSFATPAGLKLALPVYWTNSLFIDEKNVDVVLGKNEMDSVCFCKKLCQWRTIDPAMDGCRKTRPARCHYKSSGMAIKRPVASGDS